MEISNANKLQAFVLWQPQVCASVTGPLKLMPVSGLQENSEIQNSINLWFPHLIR